MTKINELTLFARFVGMKINYNNLAALGILNGTGETGYADCAEFGIYMSSLLFATEYREKFKITPAIMSRWQKKSTEITIYLFVKEDRIMGGHIKKTVNVSLQYGLVNCSTDSEIIETDVGQRELIIASEILEFLTQ